MSGPSDSYGDPYEHHYDDHRARQEGAAHFYQDTSYVQEGYYPQDSISNDGFETDGNYSYRETPARYDDYDTGSYYWQDGQTHHHVGGENNGWNDGYGSRDDVGQYSTTSSEIFFGADDSAAYDGEDIDYPPAVHPSPDPYPAWASDPQQPLTTEEIEDTFLQLTDKFGFQRESMRNMFDHLMILLDSRASRMSAEKALVSLHADYIGGRNANYRIWYFAAYLDLEAGDGTSSPGNTTGADGQTDSTDPASSGEAQGSHDFQLAEERWQRRMRNMSPQERVRQLALYLLCWGEANQVRFMPECLCFIFKCAEDSFIANPSNDVHAEESSFLDHVITPIYRFLRDQGYEIRDGVYVRRERDHDKIVGYDDCNQLFWYPAGMRRIVLNDKTKLFDIPASERLARFKDINWGKSFFKTYKESRSLLHLLVNFNRIWIIHLTLFWFYTAFNVPTLIVGPSYEQEVNQSPTNAKKLSAVGLGGAIAPFLQLVATIAEWMYVPRRWPGAEPISIKILLLLVALVLNLAPGVKIFFFPGPKKLDDYLAMGHVGLATQLFAFLAIMPSGNLFGNFFKKKSRRSTASEVFTANYPSLHGNNRIFSYLFWTLVFGAKFGESYVFLALSFRDPVRYLSIMNVDSCQGDKLFGAILCRQQPTILLVLMTMTDLIFFFLDTYLWYVLVNTVCSILRSFYIGSSIWTPWRNIFYRLPKRIYSKVLATGEMDIKYKPKVLVSQVWNAIIISMYREHLLSIEHVQKLLYHQVPSEEIGKRTLRAPTFFVAQGDHWFDSQYFPKNGEAERRISFFAQSLSTPIPEPMAVDSMPTFTVMIPHYSEKILFSLREIIREEDQYSRLTMLEYLKQLHPHEWSCFVRDTKALAGEDEPPHDSDPEAMDRKVQDLPFYFIGFKSSAPEYALRTRIWASLRSQTLYRTVSGFMNYSRAIKLLYRVENPEVVQLFRQYPEKLEMELERMARRKFRMVVAMQRYAKFKKEEQENVEFLLRAYPDLQIAYLDEEAPDEGGEPRVYSSLIDGHSEVLENGLRRPKFRIQLSGNPILGDGKSDNQNHALIFYRGEYIQLIDANQDNYLEECLKIRGVLAEFDEMSTISGYADDPKDNSPEPIAILGTREYIFSENVGILGDIAAGKEQTFGTLFARTLAQLGGKLHYGHPDFLNGIFMTTRGGVSKAQKGLHLNEDIYAGMNAIMRGGRIKHCEFYQCGKGRDLGFGSILNFVTKIGTGMGEQMLSREYFYLGTKLPLDRFLSFYYAHPGFHINNIFIMASVYMFLISLLNLGSLRHETISCNYNRDVPITDPLFPTGCVNTDALMDWVYRSILSIFFVFLMSFIPLTVQGLMESDPWRAALRFIKHVASLSPFFEVFVCQIYANAVEQNLSFGGARYIGTGRGFATARIPFSVLYARFAGPSLYFGGRLLLLLLFATLTVWQAGLTWFWVTTFGLVFSPFLYNPHQFAWDDFFIDYREFLRWLFRGHARFHGSSWITYCRLARTRITGFKKKNLGDPSSRLSGDASRASISSILFGEIFLPLLSVIMTTLPYLYINAQTGVLPKNNSGKKVEPTDSLIRLLIIAFAPVAINAGTLAVMLSLSCLMGPLLSLCCKQFGKVLASITYGISVVALIVSFEAMLFLEGFNFTRALAGMIAVVSLQILFFKVIISTTLTREFKTASSSTAFWTGHWYSLGRHSITAPFREIICKITELSMFSADFMFGHLLLFVMLPILLIPKIDKVHTTMLFWLLPSQQIREPIYSMKQSKLRRRRVVRFAVVYFIMLLVAVGLILAPLLAGKYIPSSVSDIFTDLAGFHLLQPSGLDHNNTNGTQQTGTGMPGYTGAGLESSASRTRDTAVTTQ
ncbi:1,3-beta-glucan synthase component FKS1 [Fusarium ambrosium]|uniref:1,3-beta-glucan synthase n=1 Tax=Fusarium ambrosium TaxID=131363 RepID=A0A428TY81_9HYPO|nr:1,3-beta-glucan synthase component FKS1 [Fusarium ambrosium]